MPAWRCDDFEFGTTANKAVRIRPLALFEAEHIETLRGEMVRRDGARGPGTDDQYVGSMRGSSQFILWW